ncbi:hypothetical protein M513_03064 [Trichuris suis]|uniref:Uncharacterized protein n=1 Tax=Trichuris suis TaxID=68888 RepID=A0A085MFE4_9BILA|nr:hypothetical protein M513_03064 [Trichuris suis]
MHVNCWMFLQMLFDLRKRNFLKFYLNIARLSVFGHLALNLNSFGNKTVKAMKAHSPRRHKCLHQLIQLTSVFTPSLLVEHFESTELKRMYEASLVFLWPKQNSALSLYTAFLNRLFDPRIAKDP